MRCWVTSSFTCATMSSAVGGGGGRDDVRAAVLGGREEDAVLLGRAFLLLALLRWLRLVGVAALGLVRHCRVLDAARRRSQLFAGTRRRFALKL